MRVLIWNLMHGRSVPGSGRDLFEQFAAALAAWEWEAALLQEVPPWWPPMLARRLRAEPRLVLTSRNGLLPLRRAIAIRWPDLIKSNGGGANAILVRGMTIDEHRAARLGRFPERRWMHGVRLAQQTWLCNLHSEARPAQGRAAALAARRWAGDAPVALGGDFNVRELQLEGFTRVAASGVDQLFARGLEPAGEAVVLDHGSLSDHAPVAVNLRLA